MDACNVSDFPGDAENLGLVVAFLKYLEYCLHYDDSLEPPADREIILYSLILRHVSFSCSLFICEHATPLEGRPLVQGQDGGHSAFKFDESLISFSDEVLNELESVFKLCLMYDLVKYWRSSILKNLSGETDATSAPVIDKHIPQEWMCIQPDDAQVVSEKVREEILSAILLELDNSWRRRSYAAPTISEVGQYKEIRKLVLSCLGCIQGKLQWHENFRHPIRNHLDLYHGELFGGVDTITTPYYFVVSGDLMREYTCLMMECRRHPFDVLVLKEAVNPDPKPSLPDMSFVRASNMEVDHCHNDYTCVENKTRLALLQNILQEMRTIKAQPLTAADFRFYMLVREHVGSSLWYSKNIPDYECQMQNLVASEQVRDLVASHEDLRGKTREETLRSIVSSLEYIKCRWMATPPTLEEESCYVEIRNVFSDKYHSSLLKSDLGVAPLPKEETVHGVRRFLDETLKFIRFAQRELQLDMEAVTGCEKDLAMVDVADGLQDAMERIDRAAVMMLKRESVAEQMVAYISDVEAVTGCEEDLVTMSVGVAGGLQDAMARIDRAAVMMFKRQSVAHQIVSDLSEILVNLWNDLSDQRSDDVSEQAAIFWRASR